MAALAAVHADNHTRAHSRAHTHGRTHTGATVTLTAKRMPAQQLAWSRTDRVSLCFPGQFFKATHGCSYICALSGARAAFYQRVFFQAGLDDPSRALLRSMCLLVQRVPPPRRRCCAHCLSFWERAKETTVSCRHPPLLAATRGALAADARAAPGPRHPLPSALPHPCSLSAYVEDDANDSCLLWSVDAGKSASPHTYCGQLGNITGPPTAFPVPGNHYPSLLS